jgi:hypothetical protein
MADLSDVEIALAQMVSAAIYPNGVDAPSATGIEVSVFTGWPSETQVNAAVKSSPATAIVSIIEKRGVNRLISHFSSEWYPLSTNPAPTLSASVNDETVTFSGDLSGVPINIAIIAGSVAYSMRITGDGGPGNYTIDTLLSSSVVPNASAFSSVLSAIQNEFPGATLSGDSITIPKLSSIRIGTVGTAIREVRRQSQQFQLTVWAPDAVSRSAIAKCVDSFLAVNLRLAFPDGSGGKIDYIGSTTSDVEQNADVLKRDIVFAVEYPTIESKVFAEVVNVTSNVKIKSGNTDTNVTWEVA